MGLAKIWAAEGIIFIDPYKSALYLILIKENNRLFHSDRQQSNNTGHTSIFTFLTNENTVIKPIAVWLQKTAHGAVIIVNDCLYRIQYCNQGEIVQQDLCLGL